METSRQVMKGSQAPYQLIAARWLTRPVGCKGLDESAAAPVGSLQGGTVEHVVLLRV